MRHTKPMTSCLLISNGTWEGIIWIPLFLYLFLKSCKLYPVSTIYKTVKYCEGCCLDGLHEQSELRFGYTVTGITVYSDWFMF